MPGFSMSSTGRIAAYTSSVSESISNAFLQDTNTHTQDLRINDANTGWWLYNYSGLSNNFFINRNTSSGRNMKNNGVMTQYGGFRTYSYQHWGDEIHWDLNLDCMGSGDDVYFKVEVKDATTSFTQVFEYTQYGVGTYNSGLSVSTFTPGAANTGWTYQITISNLTNPGNGNFNVAAEDYDYGGIYFVDGGPLDYLNTGGARAGYYIPLKWIFNVTT